MKKIGMVVFKLFAALAMLPIITGNIMTAYQRNGASYEQYKQLSSILSIIEISFIIFAITDCFKKFTERHKDPFIWYGAIYLFGMVAVIYSAL